MRFGETMIRLRNLLVCLATVAAASSAAAAASPSVNLEFVGVAQSSTGSFVALRSGPETSTHWTRVGGRFAGYQVVRYDVGSEVVILTDGVSTVELALRVAKVAEAREGAGGWSNPSVRRNLRLLAHAACQHFWETATIEAVAVDFVGPDRALHRVEPVSGEDYATLRFRLRSDGTVAVTDASGASVPVELPDRGAIAVTVGTTLAEVGRRLGLSEAHLAALNPDFPGAPPAGAPHLVRLW